jgi:hypothetical protein
MASIQDGRRFDEVTRKLLGNVRIDLANAITWIANRRIGFCRAGGPVIDDVAVVKADH